MKCALIALARDEDKYIQEWIDYHLNLGFNHIYICDNNDPDKKLKIENPNVTIFDYTHIDFSKSNYGETRGDKDIQQIIYGEVLEKIDTLYDFIGINDIDEFFDFKGLNLEQFIQKFLSDKYDCVTLPWVNYSDNDIVYHIDKPIQELYTKPSTKISHTDWDNTIHHCGKSIFQCRVGVQSNAHNPEPWYEFNILRLTREDGFVRHYRTKCLEDYLEHKVKCQNFSNVSICKSNIIDFYFQINDYTKDKVLYINKWVRKNNFILSDVDVATIYTLNKLFLITEEMINED